jgi:hypothetical protein
MSNYYLLSIDFQFNTFVDLQIFISFKTVFLQNTINFPEFL